MILLMRGLCLELNAGGFVLVLGYVELCVH